MSVRRRYYFWLFKAYVKRWYKTIFSSLLIGVVIFFIVAFAFDFYFLPLLQKKVSKIGYVGIYTASSIPENIMSDVSYGLTRVDKNGKIEPAASYKWTISENGREYTIYLKKGQYLHNGQELTSQTLPSNFQDVTKKDLDRYTAKYTLKSPYSPFLVSISSPILDSRLNGLGKYKISKVDINGGFVKSLAIQQVQDPTFKKVIIFYPTEEALKDAYALGSVDVAKNLQNTQIKNSNFLVWKNTKVENNTDYNQLITMFYNNNDKYLSDKKIRQALSYAAPKIFPEGERAYSPIPPNSIYFSQSPNYGISDPEISKDLLSDEKDVKKTTIEISTTQDYTQVAQRVSEEWKKIGIKSKVKVVDSLPRNFQVLIYPIKLPQDPDQYTLWHTAQIDNITHYKSLRIDKLLEDGRSTADIAKRVSIYADFQKYLIDDAPATFLYFPKTYTLERR